MLFVFQASSDGLERRGDIDAYIYMATLLARRVCLVFVLCISLVGQPANLHGLRRCRLLLYLSHRSMFLKQDLYGNVPNSYLRTFGDCRHGRG